MLPLLRHLALTFSLLLAAASTLRAQEAWTAATAPTPEHLWSVAWGAGTFVAVGERGTVLTSPDGATWTSRSSGTDAWLVGVAYAKNQFTIVGDRGTVLTSADGAAWTARATGTTERLNGVAFGHDRWLAVGEKSAVVWSRDGAAWSPVSQKGYGASTPLSGWLHGLQFAAGRFVATGERGRIVTTAEGQFFENHSIETRANLESVVFARHQFVAVGDEGLVLTSFDGASWRGRLAPKPLRAVAFFNQHFVAAATDGSILTSPDAETWTARATGNTRVLTALAGNGAALVAVGFNGTVLRSEAFAAAPTIVAAPRDLTEAAGNHVRLAVTATGSPPLTYQWQHDGRPIADATSDTLALRAISAPDAGRYTVTVTNPLGRASSSAASLTVVPEFAAPVDPTDPSFTPWKPALASGRASALLTLTDGKCYAAFGAAVARLLPDGSLDPSFGARSVPAASIEAFALQGDGRLIVGGKAGTAGPTFLARLAVDGTVDPTFRPPSLAGAITSIAIDSTGRILLANHTTRLVRLNPDGTLDESFRSADLAQFTVPSSGAPVAHLVALAPGDRVVVAAGVPGASFVGIQALVARLRSDGSLDPTFTPAHTGWSDTQLLSVRGDGRIVLGSMHNQGHFGIGFWKIQRLNVDGSPDATFAPQNGAISKYGGNMRAAIDPLGRIVIVEAMQNAPRRFRVRRLLPDGEIDPTLRYEDPADGLFNSLLDTIACLPDGRVLVSSQLGFTRLLATNAPLLNPPRPLTDDPPAPLTVVGGSNVTVNAPPVAGTGPFTYSWQVHYADGRSEQPYQPTRDTLELTALRTDAAVDVTMSNRAGMHAPAPVRFQVPPSAPVITRLPTERVVGAGRAAGISVEVLGSGPLTFRWLHDGRVVHTGTLPQEDPTLRLSRFDAAKAGDYQLVLTNALGSTTASVRLRLDDAARLVALAARGFVDDGAGAMISGFVVPEGGPKWILIRGVGPTLRAFGLADPLPGAQLTLHDARGAVLAENAGWIGSAESYTTQNWPATFPLPQGSRDAIISQRLDPGAYTVRLSGAAGATGTALLEVYENIHDTVRLANLSSRVVVGAGERVAIGGIAIGGGTTSRRLLVRAAGPALGTFGVTDALAAPVLALVDGSGATLARNEGWSESTSATDLATAAARVGAFPFASGSRDAALLVTLPPGNYSAVVSGAGNTSGTVLLEVYDVP